MHSWWNIFSLHRIYSSHSKKNKNLFSREAHIYCNIPAWGLVPWSLHMKTQSNINLFINTTKTEIHITQVNYKADKLKSLWSIPTFVYLKETILFWYHKVVHHACTSSLQKQPPIKNILTQFFI